MGKRNVQPDSLLATRHSPQCRAYVNLFNYLHLESVTKYTHLSEQYFFFSLKRHYKSSFHIIFFYLP